MEKTEAYVQWVLDMWQHAVQIQGKLETCSPEEKEGNLAALDYARRDFMKEFGRDVSPADVDEDGRHFDENPRYLELLEFQRDLLEDLVVVGRGDLIESLLHDLADGDARVSLEYWGHVAVAVRTGAAEDYLNAFRALKCLSSGGVNSFALALVLNTLRDARLGGESENKKTVVRMNDQEFDLLLAGLKEIDRRWATDLRKLLLNITVISS